jgi:arylsulfatase A-like enzyme
MDFPTIKAAPIRANTKGSASATTTRHFAATRAAFMTAAFARPAWPGKLAPAEVQSPVHAVDWMPTLCALAGVKPATELKWDGINVWPLLIQSAGSLPVRTIYSAAPGFRAQMVRHGDWKLIVTSANDKKSKAGQVELFNVVTDPGESKNLATP